MNRKKKKKTTNPHKFSEDMFVIMFKIFLLIFLITRMNSNQQYLNENRNIRKMYILYKEKWSEVNILSIKEHMYHYI